MKKMISMLCAIVTIVAFTSVADARPRAKNHHARSHHTKIVKPVENQSFSFFSPSLVGQARQYLGTNPTGRARLWCGAFMDMILKQTGHRGGGNLALAYKNYGTRISGPQVGAIAVMGRKGGPNAGHVGVVTGISEDGNPIIISGNHNHTVAEAEYPRQRIMAYVIP